MHFKFDSSFLSTLDSFTSVQDLEFSFKVCFQDLQILKQAQLLKYTRYNSDRDMYLTCLSALVWILHA